MNKVMRVLMSFTLTLTDKPESRRAGNPRHARSQRSGLKGGEKRFAVAVSGLDIERQTTGTFVLFHRSARNSGGRTEVTASAGRGPARSEKTENMFQPLTRPDYYWFQRLFICLTAALIRTLHWYNFIKRLNRITWMFYVRTKVSFFQ